MGGILIGFALGAMTFTKTGREMGNQLALDAMKQLKKIGEKTNDNNQKNI